MSAGEKLVGGAAVLMALCCAFLPFVGAAVGGGLIAGAGAVGVVLGVVVLAGIGVFLWRRRTGRSRC